VHVRFLDNASRAVAKVASNRRWPLVTTLTPDPHRTLCTPEGHIRPHCAETAREVFNRILIGDQLLHWSRGIAAIGRNAFTHELIHYFPQLENTRGKVLAAIDEGVATTPPLLVLDPAALLCDSQLDLALTPQQLATPLILSVGRLHPIKGQVNLVRAWAHSPLWQRYNLVIIGGDLDTPSVEERAIIDAIRAEWRPGLQGRLCHLPAQDNATVRAILAWSGQRQPSAGADIYVCASLKEEFGLSILEAMAAGLPVCAPLRGGPKTYLRHGVNGFLIDTRDTQVLRKELCALLNDQRLAETALHKLKQNARHTVERHYSLTAMAAEYADFYRRVNERSS
jgi:glycosyltransferase involved in cell wall biosynthesis